MADAALSQTAGDGRQSVMGDVRLVDLDVIKRYSLALRQEAAPAEEVLAVLEASRQQVLAAMRPERRGRRRQNPGTRP